MAAEPPAELAVEAILDTGRKLLAESRRLLEELDGMVVVTDPAETEPSTPSH